MAYHPDRPYYDDPRMGRYSIPAMEAIRHKVRHLERHNFFLPPNYEVYVRDIEPRDYADYSGPYIIFEVRERGYGEHMMFQWEADRLFGNPRRVADEILHDFDRYRMREAEKQLRVDIATEKSGTTNSFLEELRKKTDEILAPYRYITEVG